MKPDEDLRIIINQPIESDNLPTDLQDPSPSCIIRPLFNLLWKDLAGKHLYRYF